MVKNAYSIKATVSWLLKMGLLAAIPYSLYVGDYLFVFAALSAVTISLLPAYWYRRFRVILPFSLDLFITMALFLHVFFGEILRYYDHHWYFDKLMHFYGTGLIALIAFVTIFTFHWSSKIVLSLPLIAYFTIVFAVAIGTFWEMGEFAIDKIFGRNTQYSLENTMWDLVLNLIGGIVAACFGSWYVGKQKKKGLDRLTSSIQTLFESP
ncbi:MAG TPA: hypothetical protein DDW49_05865 [Deltaproteobacteria bacterium]|nr:MAG: hypothetical protein A2048_04245 [Deltaproteobacteria bacterium GWA2_45_12]HBF12900.1 hypothetical protein [Deltaproteobacteria bacterium]